VDKNISPGDRVGPPESTTPEPCHGGKLLSNLSAHNASSRPQVHRDFRRKGAIEVMRFFVGTADVDEKRLKKFEKEVEPRSCPDSTEDIPVLGGVKAFEITNLVHMHCGLTKMLLLPQLFFSRSAFIIGDFKSHFPLRIVTHIMDRDQVRIYVIQLF